MKCLSVLAALLLLGVDITAYICSENLGGRIAESWSRLGYLVLLPGYLVEMLLTGNVHASFGDAWDIVIKIGFSYVICFAIGFAIFRSLAENREKNPET